MEWRRWSGGGGVEGEEWRQRRGNGANCQQNLVMAKITPILRIGGVVTFVHVKSQQTKAVDASFV